MKDGQCSFLLTMLILLIAGQRELLYFVMERLFKQEDILKQANLKHPMMFDVYDILKEKGIVPDGDVYPKNIAEFQAMVKGL